MSLVCDSLQFFRGKWKMLCWKRILFIIPFCLIYATTLEWKHFVIFGNFPFVISPSFSSMSFLQFSLFLCNFCYLILFDGWQFCCWQIRRTKNVSLVNLGKLEKRKKCLLSLKILWKATIKKIKISKWKSQFCRILQVVSVEGFS